MIPIAEIDLSFFTNITVHAVIDDSTVTKGSVLLNGDASEGKEAPHSCLDNIWPCPSLAL